MINYTDQMGRKCTLNGPPRRIISLVPSQTELLYDLGLEQEVVGITKFCVHPSHWFRQKTRVGGTKQIHLDRIRELKPDLIIGNKEENTREMIETLEQHWPVWMSDVRNLEDALEMIRNIGQITQRTSRAEELAQSIAQHFEQLQAFQFPKLKALYLIWYQPIMGVGSDTFIHQMLERAGFENVLRDYPRYPTLNEATIQALAPEIILLSSEPFPFKEKHLSYFSRLCPRAKVQKVDGELFSWYGSRLLKSPEYFRSIREME